MKILVITNKEYNETTRKTEEIVSHGIDCGTFEGVVLPPVHPTEVGAKWDIDLQEWILEE